MINASTTEKRLLINIKASSEEYNEEIIDDTTWIRRKYILANAVT